MGGAAAMVMAVRAPEQKEADPEDAGGGRAVAYAEGDNLDHACALIVAVAADIIPCWRWSGSRPWRPRSLDTHCSTPTACTPGTPHGLFYISY
eukprot:scaffold23050_cov60-Phaeocystis_antarctica.AAC.1